MKRIVRIVIHALVFAMLFPMCAGAALTESQQQAVVNFTENFLEEGNKRRLLQYGNVDNFKCLQGQLVHCDTIYRADGKTKILWMMKPGGYRNQAEYIADLGRLDEGDYLSLSCVTFCALMYKYSLGFRLDYAAAGHLSNWDTSKFKENPMVTTYDGSGSVNLFEVVFEKETRGKMSFARYVDPSILQPGDIIVGRYDPENYGHAVLSGGGDVVYQASMSPIISKNGRYEEFLVRKDSLASLTNNSYTHIAVYRISDKVLDPEFKGYDDMFDFDSLSTTASVFDTDKPEILSVAINETPESDGRYAFTLRATDEIAPGRVTTLADDPTVVMRGNANHQSGVLAYYCSTSDEPPTDVYAKGWSTAKTNTFTGYLPAGTYNIWVKDAAGNYSDPWVLTAGKDGVSACPKASSAVTGLKAGLYHLKTNVAF
ncbi:MAG: hypothetical protein E7655_06650 [Ruminococcaceae bacterium]|nr:hypothetical protein [Oscillospiraceae bacterium]